MQRIARAAVKYSKATLTVVLLLTVVFALGLPRLRVDDEIINMIAPDHPARILQERIERDFGVRDVAILAIENTQGIFNPASLAHLAQLTRFLQGVPGVAAEDVASFAASDNVVARGDELLMRPPLVGTSVTPQQAAAIQREVLDNPLFVGRLVSADGSVAALYAPLRPGATRESVYAAITEYLARMPASDNGDRILVSGKVMVEGGLGTAMRTDLKRLGPIVVGVLLVLLTIYFRHPLLALLPVLTAVVSVIWTLGLMGALGVPIHVPTTLIPVMLLVIGITEEVHLIGEYRARGKTLERRAAVLAALDRIRRPVTFMTLTTAIGFASPALSPIVPLGQFGLFTAFGIGVAYLLTFTLSPAYLALIKRPRSWAQPKESAPARWLRALGERSARHPLAVAIVLALAATAALAGAMHMRVDENWVNRFKPGHVLYDSDQRLNQALGGTTLLYAQVTTSADALKDPVLLQRIETLQTAIAALPGVGKVTSIVDLVKRTNRVLHADDPHAERLPGTRTAIAQQLLLLESSADPNDLEGWIDARASRALLWIQLQDPYASTAAALLPKLETLAREHIGAAAGVTFGGPASVNVAMAELIVKSQLLSLVVALAAEFLVLWFLYRSFAWALLCLVPLAIALPAIFALLAASGRYVDIPMAVLASIVIGLAVDYAIYVLDRYRHARSAGEESIAAAGRAVSESGAIVVADGLALGAGFCVLLLSNFAPLTAIGLLTAGVLIGSAALALLLPALGQWLRLPAAAKESA